MYDLLIYLNISNNNYFSITLLFYIIRYFNMRHVQNYCLFEKDEDQIKDNATYSSKLNVIFRT